MSNSLKKTVSIIGGLAIGIGITYLLKIIDAFDFSDEMWIGLGVLLSLCVGVSLYFMTKGSG